MPSSHIRFFFLAWCVCVCVGGWGGEMDSIACGWPSWVVMLFLLAHSFSRSEKLLMKSSFGWIQKDYVS